MKKYIYELMTDKRRDVLACICQFFLFVLSLFYGLGVAVMVGLYQRGVLRKARLSKPVISVGNLTFGGVGKTPLVISIVEFLRREGMRPAVLLRGYMDKTNANDAADPHETRSDEAVLLKESLPDTPVLVGADRIASAGRIVPDTVDAFILDDAFQHWKLERQLDIVAIDATNPFGNGHILPRGILREPLWALARADFFVITKSDQGQQSLEMINAKIRAVNRDAPVVYARHRPVALIDMARNDILPLSSLDGQRVCSFCSIGDPHSFLSSLSSIGVLVDKNFDFMDHYIYTRQDMDQIVDFCHSNEIKVIMTTQKDAVKIKEFLGSSLNGLQVITLKIAMEFTKGQDLLFKQILNICQRIS